MDKPKICQPQSVLQFPTDMGRFKKGSTKRTVLLPEDVKFLTENTNFSTDHIEEWHEVTAICFEVEFDTFWAKVALVFFFWFKFKRISICEILSPIIWLGYESSILSNYSCAQKLAGKWAENTFTFILTLSLLLLTISFSDPVFFLFI